MSETITLPSGGTATLRDPETLNTRDKRFVKRRAAAGEAANANELGVLVEDAVAMALVEAWSLPYRPDAKLPIEDPDGWDTLPPGDSDAIMAAARPAVPILFPAPPTPDDADKPGSPTAPTSD